MKKFLMTLTLALGAMIAIPASAQSTSTDEQKTECCKQKKAFGKECRKECRKDSAICQKEGKACCQDAGKGRHKTKAGKMIKGDRRAGGPKAKAMLHRGAENPLMKGITLSEEQQKKMKDLRDKNLAAEKKSKADAKAKSKDEVQKLRAEFDKEVEKILDKDQLKQYQANKAELDAKRAARHTK